MLCTLMPIHFFFASVLSSTNTSLPDIESEYEILLTSNERNKHTAEQEVVFDYNEDYSQLRISSQEQEGINHAETTTQKINNSTLDFNELYLNSSQTVREILYQDNSYGNQQIVERKLKRIFNVGLINIDKKMPADFNPPQFMTDLYHTVTKQNKDDLKTLAYGASTIISLPETDPSTPGLFKFDLSEIHNQEILEAELHIYRIGREVSIPLHHSPYYLLRVYQILPNGNLMSWNPDVNQLLNVHYVSSFITGWQVFKIKRALDSWLNESAPNMGFLVTASSVINEPIDINFARRNRFSNKYQPSLVLFTKTKQDIEDPVYPHHHNVMESQNSQSTECFKTSMYVNFTENYFKNFIIEPKGFEQYQCLGTCEYPENMQSPNYSLLKSVLNNMNVTSNNLCCIPEKFKYLIVLYLAGDKVVLQQIENVIIEACSCR